MERQKLEVCHRCGSERPIDTDTPNRGRDAKAPIASKDDDRLVRVNVDRISLEKRERLDFSWGSGGVSTLPVQPDETTINAPPPHCFCLESYGVCDFRRRDVSVCAILRLLAQPLYMFQRSNVLLVAGVIVCWESVGMKDTVGVFRNKNRRLARPCTTMETRAGRVLGIEEEVVNFGQICSELASDEVDRNNCVVGRVIMLIHAVFLRVGFGWRLMVKIDKTMKMIDMFTTWRTDNEVRDGRAQVGDGGWELGGWLECRLLPVEKAEVCRLQRGDAGRVAQCLEQRPVLDGVLMYNARKHLAAEALDEHVREARRDLAKDIVVLVEKTLQRGDGVLHLHNGAIGLELSDDGCERVCAAHDVGVGVDGEGGDDGKVRWGEFMTVLQQCEEEGDQEAPNSRAGVNEEDGNERVDEGEELRGTVVCALEDGGDEEVDQRSTDDWRCAVSK